MIWMNLAALAAEIPERPATVQESLELMGVGWGCIFLVIIIMMIAIAFLNRAFRK